MPGMGERGSLYVKAVLDSGAGISFIATLPGDKTLLLGRATLGMLGISPDAERDRIARSNFEYSSEAYQWYDSRQKSLISSAEHLGME